MEPDQQDVALSAYLRSVWTEAAAFGATPVLKCTRSALRAEWISRLLPCRHIYIFRDPRLIDTSNFSFRGYSNPYVRDYALVVGQNSDKAIFAELARWSGLARFVSASLDEEYTYYSRQIRDHSPGRYDRQFHFNCLIFFWLLALGLATRYADLIVDVDTLRDKKIRSTIEESIRDKTGLAVDLSDYRVDDDRLQRALRRHPYAVSRNVLEITRDALSLVNPCWSKIAAVPLGSFGRDIVGLIQ